MKQKSTDLDRLEKLINNLTREKPEGWQDNCRMIQEEIQEIIETQENPEGGLK